MAKNKRWVRIWQWRKHCWKNQTNSSWYQKCKSKYEYTPFKKSELIFVTEKYEKEILEAKEFILKLGFGTEIKIQKDKTGISENAITIMQDGIELYMPLEDLVDMDEERKRLQEEKTKLEAEVARCEKMLSNPGFVNKAPEAKINEEKAKLEKYHEMLKSVEERLK